MGGTLVLEKSSCRKCADVISAAEGFCQRNMFPGIRALYELYGRQRKKTRPTAFRLRVKTKRKLLDLQVPIAEYPFMAIFPKLEPAGLISFRRIEDCRWPDFVNDRSRSVLWEYNETRERLRRLTRKYSAITIDVPLEMCIAHFCRLLAKIGYSAAVAHLGYDALTPLLLEYIRAPLRADLQPLLFYIGQAHDNDGVEIVELPTYGDQVPYKMATYIIDNIETGEQYVATRVQIFAHMNAPIYEVISARLNPSHAAVAEEARRRYMAFTEGGTA